MGKSTQTREWWFRCLCSCSWQVEKMFEYSHVFLMSSAGMLCYSWEKHCLPGMCSLNCVLATCSFSSPRPLLSALRAFDFLGIWWAYLWLCCDKQTSPKLDLLGRLSFIFSPFLSMLVWVSTPFRHSWSQLRQHLCVNLATPHQLFFWSARQNRQNAQPKKHRKRRYFD